MTDEHVILVAFTVYDERGREHAEQQLWTQLPDPNGVISSWWIAEDDRRDGSDCDSAIFVPRGAQSDMDRLVRRHINATAELLEKYQYADTDVSGAWYQPRTEDAPQASDCQVHFQPQAWVRDYAIDTDDEGPDTWNVTEETAQAIAEALVNGNSDLDFVREIDPLTPEWVRNYHGPFEISVIDQED